MVAIVAKRYAAASLVGLVLFAALVMPGPWQSPALAKADTDTRVFHDRFQYTLGYECLGELVAFDGIFFGVVHSTTDTNGTFHHLERSNLVGRGVGLTSGDRYVVHSYGPEWVWSTSNGERNLTVNGRINFVRVGGEENGSVFRTHFVSHITVTPDGGIAADFDRSSIVCR